MDVSAKNSSSKSFNLIHLLNILFLLLRATKGATEQDNKNKHGNYSKKDDDGEGGVVAAGSRKSGGHPFKAAEVEQLLKHGAQKLFTEEHDRAIERFSSESIEQILQRCATTTMSNETEKTTTGGAFSKASFGVEEAGEAGRRRAMPGGAAGGEFPGRRGVVPGSCCSSVAERVGSFLDARQSGSVGGPDP